MNMQIDFASKLGYYRYPHTSVCSSDTPLGPELTSTPSHSFFARRVWLSMLIQSFAGISYLPWFLSVQQKYCPHWLHRVYQYLRFSPHVFTSLNRLWPRSSHTVRPFTPTTRKPQNLIHNGFSVAASMVGPLLLSLCDPPLKILLVYVRGVFVRFLLINLNGDWYDAISFTLGSLDRLPELSVGWSPCLKCPIHNPWTCSISSTWHLRVAQSPTF
jgi:hypothetical protein